MWNMPQLTFICVMNFAFILLPTGSPLMKLGQFWPLLPSPGQTKCYMTAKSSLLHSIYIFRKSKKKLATFPINFFRGIAKVSSHPIIWGSQGFGMGPSYEIWSPLDNSEVAPLANRSKLKFIPVFLDVLASLEPTQVGGWVCGSDVVLNSGQ